MNWKRGRHKLRRGLPEVMVVAVGLPIATLFIKGIAMAVVILVIEILIALLYAAWHANH